MNPCAQVFMVSCGAAPGAGIGLRCSFRRFRRDRFPSARRARARRRWTAHAPFVASPLLRTRETMELARDAMGLSPKRYRLDPALRELTFGDWEGLTWPEVKAPDGKMLSATFDHVVAA